MESIRLDGFWSPRPGIEQTISCFSRSEYVYFFNRRSFKAVRILSGTFSKKSVNVIAQSHFVEMPKPDDICDFPKLHSSEQTDLPLEQTISLLPRPRIGAISKIQYSVLPFFFYVKGHHFRSMFII